MKVYILYECPNWSARNHAKAIKKHAPTDWEVVPDWWTGHHREWKYDDANVIINLGSNAHESLYELCCARAPDALLISRYNTQYPRYSDKFDMLHECSDIVLVESRACRAAIPGRYGKVQICPSGVDRELFRVTVPPHQRPSKVLWCAGIIGQAAERGDVKRYEFAKELVGRLQSLGLEMELLTVDPNGESVRSPEAMVDWYNSGRIFVCTSKMEGLPNTCLEAAACGCMIVTTQVGVMPEFIQHGKNGFLCAPTQEAFVHVICKANKQYTGSILDIRHRIAEWDWSILAGNYFQMIDALLCARLANEEEAVS